MKYNSYYGVQRPWSLPSWMGRALAGFFCFIGLLSVVFMVQLLRMSHAQMQPPTPAAPAMVAQSAVEPAPTLAPAAKTQVSKRATTHKAAARRSFAAKVDKMNRRNQAVLAHHDSRSKRREKDALDRVLGL